MNKESLEVVKERLHLLVDDPRVDMFDKIELLINLLNVLENYDENMKVLEQHRKLKLKREDDE